MKLPRPLRSWPELRVRYRIALSLGAIATLATLLTLVVPHYRLAGDLEQAGIERLERSTAATLELLADLQAHVGERHRAMARTPEFRANLETAHVPTLYALAENLVAQQGSIDAVVFTNSQGARVAAAGPPPLRAKVDAMVFEPPTAGCAASERAEACGEIVGPGDPILFAADSRLILGTSIPLFVRGRFVGRVAFVETQNESVLAEWSRLLGAEVSLREATAAPDAFERVALAIEPLELRVRASFDAERAALGRLRATILSAGLLALGVAYALAGPLARGLLRPLREIEEASGRIRDGDLETRLRSGRRDEFGDVARAFDTMLDHLEATQEGLERAQSIGRLGGWSCSEDGLAFSVTRELRRILELDPETAIVDRARILRCVHPADRATFETALRRCERDGLSFGIDHRVVRSDGRERIVHTRGERSASSKGRSRMQGTIQDVTERKRIEDQVRVLAYQDGLTGLGNRRLFAEDLQRAISLGRQNLRPLAVLFLDLDDFKIVNDTLGHGIGDQLLCVVADRLQAVVGDMQDETDAPSVHRLGGDEFAIILPQLDDWEGVQRCAQAIAERLGESVDLDGYDVQVSASVGIATWPDEGLDVASLLAGCDTAMYHAKLQGRGEYRFYDPSMREASERRLRMEGRLRRAIDRDELAIVYQPKVEPWSGRVAGLEALLRWRDHDLGPVSPDEFVMLAEETGQILALGEWVLVQVARQARIWMDAGVCDVPIAVNVSSAQIESDTLLETVMRILREAGLPPSRLDLEVTESALLRSEERAIEVLGALREAGIKLALDDFGTGYSSLGYLRRLPLDAVKIDRSFVRDIVHDAQDRALVASIISMAHVLGLEVIVEGVEEESQRAILGEIGCEMIQGYFYSEGVPAEQIPEILAKGFAGS
jgi:diguanylate cyclase (GGDEF)-like protein/PAS domain S-box-containing protein